MKPRVRAGRPAWRPVRRNAPGSDRTPTRYDVTMVSYAELPDLPANASLIAYLRSQASPPSGAGDYTLGPWQLHTHPDLMSLLRSLAPDLPVTGAYGVPLLETEGVAAVVALGMDWLAVRVDELPPGIEADADEPPQGLSIADGWHVILAWQDNSQALTDLVSAALARAASLGRQQG